MIKHHPLIILCAILLLSSCKKEDKCISSITNEYAQDIHFNKLSSCGITPEASFTLSFSSIDEFYSNNPCGSSQPVPVPLNFNGIVVAQGVKVPYVGPNGGDPGYNLSIEILKDECEKIIFFEFILQTIDTSRSIDHNENVLVLLDKIDSSYQVIFSHQIIPYTN